MKSLEGFRKGLKNFALLSRADKNWVTSEVFRCLRLDEMGALDDFIASLQAASDALRGGISVFMSHSSLDKRFVRPLAKYLESHGITVWLDEADLMAGEPLLDRLTHALNDTSLLVAVLSKHSVNSAWVKKELALAVNRELKGGGVTVVPLLKDDCKIPSFIANKLYLDFRTSAKRRKNRPVLVDTLMRLASQNAKVVTTEAARRLLRENRGLK